MAKSKQPLGIGTQAPDEATNLRELADASSAAEAQIAQALQSHIAITRELLSAKALIAQLADTLIKAFANGKKVLLCGNGGSAADAQHIAAEFVGRFYFDRPPLPAAALTANTSSLTAIGNDYAFDQVFARQVEALGVPGDVCMGISTSGHSRNVLEALRVARRKGMVTVAMTGVNGGHMKEEADFCICIPSACTPRIQEHHILVGHLLCELVEQALFNKASMDVAGTESALNIKQL